MPSPHCPSCGTDCSSTFHKTSQIPTNSTILIDSLEDALSFNRSDLELAYCTNCGFIWNHLFHHQLLSEENSETTQGFSKTFQKFTEKLIEKLINKYQLLNKTVIEIGCGSGDFIQQLCQRGFSKGIGIDPACSPGRIDNKTPDKLSFVSEPYNDSHKTLSADLICCRHTLEHIHNTREFISMLRDNLEEYPNTLLFFEVPETKRILTEVAFWDIYYEHCSYFTQSSLQELFESCGFEVLENSLEYKDQYITLYAKPAPRDPLILNVSTISDTKTSIEPTDIETFQAKYQSIQATWSKRLINWADSNKTVVIWGSGSKSIGFIFSIPESRCINYVIDINPYKNGKLMPGTHQQIVQPSKLKSISPDVVIIMNEIYFDEISAEISKMGLQPEILALS